MLKSLALTLMIAVAAPAAAQTITFDSPPPAPAADKKSESDLDRIVCPKIERVGSRRAKEKVCMSARQWKDHTDGHRHDLESIQRIQNTEPSG